MSKPVFSDLFRFSGRRNRKSYFLLHLSFLALSIPIFAFAFLYLKDAIDSRAEEVIALSPLISIMLVLIGLPWTIIGILAAVQRLHDFGWTGWAWLLTFIPVIGPILWLALFFIPGTRGPNRYGPDPRETAAVA